METYPDVLTNVEIITPMAWDSNQLILKTQFANGTESRRLLWSSPRRTFTLNYKAVTKEKFAILYNFYKNRKGPFEAFLFTIPHSSPLESATVRYSDEGIQIVDTKSLFIDATINLIEL